MMNILHSSQRRPKAAVISGFTLIEVMVVVAIIGILMAIALPSYRVYVERGDRAAARAAMLEAQQFMERFYATNNTFLAAVLPARFTAVPAEAPKYNIAPSNLAAGTFTLTATPIGTVAKCGNLTLTHTGEKSVTVPASPTPADIAECWK